MCLVARVYDVGALDSVGRLLVRDERVMTIAETSALGVNCGFSFLFCRFIFNSFVLSRRLHPNFLGMFLECAWNRSRKVFFYNPFLVHSCLVPLYCRDREEASDRSLQNACSHPILALPRGICLLQRANDQQKQNWEYRCFDRIDGREPWGQGGRNGRKIAASLRSQQERTLRESLVYREG